MLRSPLFQKVPRGGEKTGYNKSHCHWADGSASPEKLGPLSSSGLQKASTHNLRLCSTLLLIVSLHWLNLSDVHCNNRALSWRCSSVVCLWGSGDACCIQLRCDLTAVPTRYAANDVCRTGLKHRSEISAEPKLKQLNASFTVRICKFSKRDLCPAAQQPAGWKSSLPLDSICKGRKISLFQFQSSSISTCDQ